MSAQVRPTNSPDSGPIRESGSFAAHLKTLERTIPLRGRYENFIGGKWVAPVKGAYFDNISPTTGQVICKIARSQAEDIELAVDAAHAAAGAWGRTAVAQRAAVLNKIADRMEQYLPFLAAVETYDNGKPIRETNLADLPLAVDHFRYFASCVRAQEGSLGELDDDTVAYHYHEPLGVVGQIIPWNFPILMAAWKLAPALAAGNAVIIKPAEQTPMSLLVLAELCQDLIPPGVLNIVNGFGLEAGKPLATNSRIAKIAFTGETTTGRLIMQYASENIIPVTLELGGKSPNIFFDDVMREDDDFVDKALEGFAMFALNQGEVCTCPSRALVQKSIYDRFMERAIKRVEAIRQGDPYEMSTQIGAQASNDQYEKILSYIDIGKKEGAKVLAGGVANKLAGDLSGGYYIKPTVFEGHNKMRVFQEEIFGPVVSVTTFNTPEEALEIANDTLYGLGSGIWTRDINKAYRFGRGIKAGRVWTNCYHAYPAHAAFGGYKKSGIGRETHKMMLDHYQQTKNVLVELQHESLGLFLVHCVLRTGVRARVTPKLVRRSLLPYDWRCRLNDEYSKDPERVSVTPRARRLIEQLKGAHGPIMFHLSGGCCDGSAPMCFQVGEFKLGSVDEKVGEIAGCEFWMDRAQFKLWAHTRWTVDVVPGRGGSFSLEAPLNLRFLIRSEMCAVPTPPSIDAIFFQWRGHIRPDFFHRVLSSTLRVQSWIASCPRLARSMTPRQSDEIAGQKFPLLYNLVYCSRAGLTVDDAVVARIIKSAQRHNLPRWDHRTAGIREAVFFFNGSKGPRDNVTQLMRRIEADPRHDTVVKLSESEEFRERIFPDWDMELVDAGDIHDVLDDALAAAEDAESRKALEQLLKKVASELEGLSDLP